jgi:hypothetical protein
MLRREVVKGLLGAACATCSATPAFSAVADTKPPGSAATRGLAIKLAKALISLGCSVCMDTALYLDTSQKNTGDISLHLRSAGLDESDVGVITRAFWLLKKQEALALGSFSLSYNPGIGNAGVIALALSLPITVQAIGLVAYEIGNRGGEAILSWVGQASQLRIICVEENQFSDTLKRRFRALTETDRNLLVVV